MALEPVISEALSYSDGAKGVKRIRFRLCEENHEIPSLRAPTVPHKVGTLLHFLLPWYGCSVTDIHDGEFITFPFGRTQRK